MRNAKLLLLNAGLVFSLAGIQGCSHRHDDQLVEQKTEKDVDENVFTGSKTYTEENEATYRNPRTGKEYDQTTKKKVKYDRDGNKISETNEQEQAR